MYWGSQTGGKLVEKIFAQRSNPSYPNLVPCLSKELSPNALGALFKPDSSGAHELCQQLMVSYSIGVSDAR
jgi:hypothetical protein